MIIGGDFNAHDTASGYNHTNGRGQLILEHATAKRLIVSNTVPCLPTYFKASGIGSWPDVTLSSNVGESLVTKLEVLDEVTGSDHRYIQFEIKGSAKILKSKWYKTKTENIRIFRNNLVENRTQLNNLFRNHGPD